MRRLFIIPIALLLIQIGIVQSGDTQCTEISPKTAQTDTFILEYTDIPKRYKTPLSNHLYDYLARLCKESNLPIENMLALIKIESDFEPDLISKTNDWGLCQINACNHRRLRETLGVTDFLDPYQNIQCGVFLIAELQNKYNETDFNKTLMRYNLGETGAMRRFDKGIYETHYTRKWNIAMKELMNCGE